MHIPKISLLSLLLISPLTGLYAAEFENGVPVELVEQVSNGQLSADLPVDFPDIDLPDSVSVMGSLDTNFSQIIVFTSSVPTDQAGMELAESFMNSGWIRLQSITYEQPQNGFVYPNPAPLPLQPGDEFCNDGFGTISITMPDSAPNIVNLRMNNQALMQPGFSCRQQNEQRLMQRNRGVGFPFSMQNSQYLPRLEYPEDENRNRPRPPFFGGGGFSGSNNDIEARGNFAGDDWTVEELKDHFAAQLEDQGWQLDSDWSGDVSAGGNWTLNPEDNLNFIGVLEVLERTEGIFELKFRLITRGANQGANIFRGTIQQGVIVNDVIRAAPADRAGQN